MQLPRFFEENGVDDCAAIAVSEIPAPEGFRPTDLLPSFKTVIVFAKVIPRFVFEVDSKVKSFHGHQFVNHLDNIAFKLSDMLCSTGSQSTPVPTFFPVRIHDGKLRGFLSLKHVAAAAGMGSLGMNTLLISERFGNTLGLFAVLSKPAASAVR